MGWLGELVDPNGETIIPSFYSPNGTLVLGFNPSTGNVIYRASGGFLVYTGDLYFAVLYGNETFAPSSTFQVVLNPVSVSIPGTTSMITATVTSFIGTATNSSTSSTAIPYSLEVTRLGFGSVVFGNSASWFAFRAGYHSGRTFQSKQYYRDPDLDSPAEAAYLAPAINVQGSGGTYLVTARSILSNGTSVPATAAVLVLNSTVLPMNQTNDTSFFLNVSYHSPTTTMFHVYVSDPSIIGGFAYGFLPAVIHVNSSSSTTVVSSSSGVTSYNASAHSVPAEYGQFFCLAIDNEFYFLFFRKPIQRILEYVF